MVSLVTPVSYASSGQQVGETRSAMAKKLMEYVEEILCKCKKITDKYYILVHAKPYPQHPNLIKQKIIVLPKKPAMMLSCMLFGVDNKEGKLTLEWALPGDWPIWAVGGKNEPVAETIASYDRLNTKLKMKSGNPFFDEE